MKETETCLVDNNFNLHLDEADERVNQKFGPYVEGFMWCKKFATKR